MVPKARVSVVATIERYPDSRKEPKRS